MQNVSIFIQLFGGILCIAYAYNVGLLIINQLKNK